MKMMKNLRNTLTVTAIFYIVFGLVMLLIPVVVSSFICYLIASLFLVIGFMGIYSYIKNRGLGFGSSIILVFSILFLALGIFILFNPVSFVSFIPLVVGIMLIIDSVNKFQTAIDLKNNGYKSWWHMFLVSSIILLLGLMLIFNPFKSIELFIRIIGALLIFDGLSNLFALYSYSKIKR